ncbi:hypothetical protein K438DRAFT_1991257 [Mycena galopus ATCC 62051]|nr:hypothetical protein K438DRAFT_1991257 [Mycena galopus ATCC 62051]
MTRLVVRLSLHLVVLPGAFSLVVRLAASAQCEQGRVCWSSCAALLFLRTGPAASASSFASPSPPFASPPAFPRLDASWVWCVAPPRRLDPEGRVWCTYHQLSPPLPSPPTLTPPTSREDSARCPGYLPDSTSGRVFGEDGGTAGTHRRHSTTSSSLAKVGGGVEQHPKSYGV